MDTKYNRLYRKIVNSQIFLEKSALDLSEIPDEYRIARTSKNKWLKLVAELVYNETRDKLSGDSLYKRLNKILGEQN